MNAALLDLFKFKLGEVVTIINVGCTGTVIARIEELSSGVQYQVVWWSNGSRNMSWLYDWELEHVLN